MDMESKRATVPTPPELEKSKILEEVFKRYHKKLLVWCRYKLIKKYFTSNHISDAEEIVAHLYQNLLASKNPIDLTRSESEIREFLNISLDHAIHNFFLRERTKKRNPEGGLVSIEELVDEGGEDDLPFKLKQYFTEHSDEEGLEAKASEIEQAISVLEGRNKREKRMADIIRQIYQLGRTGEEVAKDYGITYPGLYKIKVKAEASIRKIIGRIRRGEIKKEDKGK